MNSNTITDKCNSSLEIYPRSNRVIKMLTSPMTSMIKRVKLPPESKLQLHSRS